MRQFRPRQPNREPWRNWYGLTIWRKRRAHQLSIQPLCEHHLTLGQAVPATIADHVEPHRGNWNSFVLGALQSLCKSCHDSQKKLQTNQGFANDFGVDGWPLDPKHPANRKR